MRFARYHAEPQSLPATDELARLDATEDLLLDFTEDLLELFDDAGVDDAAVPPQVPSSDHSCHWPE